MLSPTLKRGYAPDMVTRNLFATPLFEADIADQAMLEELAHSIRSLAIDDRAGIGWSRDHGYKGYTSYASLDDLPMRDPAFGALKRLLTRHAAAFAKDLAWEVKP
ncbi:MAG TPA: TIGR02466 family protein, partial [Sphingomicrobium sp.]|nr:TIGR02466 family protein [Sphingomicrobium sp.]